MTQNDEVTEFNPDDFLVPAEDKTDPELDAMHLEQAIEAVEAYERHLQEVVDAREAKEPPFDPWHDITDDQLGEKVQEHLRIVAAMVMRLEARHAQEKSNES